MSPSKPRGGAGSACEAYGALIRRAIRENSPFPDSGIYDLAVFKLGPFSST